MRARRGSVSPVVADRARARRVQGRVPAARAREERRAGRVPAVKPLLVRHRRPQPRDRLRQPRLLLPRRRREVAVNSNDGARRGTTRLQHRHRHHRQPRRDRNQRFAVCSSDWGRHVLNRHRSRPEDQLRRSCSDGEIRAPRLRTTALRHCSRHSRRNHPSRRAPRFRGSVRRR